MKIQLQLWRHVNVKKNGKLPNKLDGSRVGSVNTKPMVTSGLEPNNGSLTNPEKAWLCVNTGIDEFGTVEGVTIWFNNEEELRETIASLYKKMGGKR